MALTDTQRTNALILAAQGDTPERIAALVAAPIDEVKKALPKPRTAAKTDEA